MTADAGVAQRQPVVQVLAGLAEFPGQGEVALCNGLFDLQHDALGIELVLEGFQAQPAEEVGLAQAGF